MPEIEKDYEVFKENRPIHFIERDIRLCNHLMANQLDEDHDDHLTQKHQQNINLITGFEFNKKFAHHNEVDNQLNEVLQLVFQDFITPWQQHVSLSHEFPYKLYLFLNYTISAFVRRLDCLFQFMFIIIFFFLD